MKVALSSGCTALTMTLLWRRRPAKTLAPDASVAQSAALPPFARACAAETVDARRPPATGSLPLMLMLVNATPAMVATSHSMARSAFARAPTV